jgi:TatD DNase family protein
MHYFAGDVALAERYVELGFLISIHTSVTSSNSERLQDVARRLPLDALLVETDSPYGVPHALRPREKRGEPAHVAHAVDKIAELRGEPPKRVAEATTENALRLFGPARAAVCAGSVEGSA